MSTRRPHFSGPASVRPGSGVLSSLAPPFGPTVPGSPPPMFDPPLPLPPPQLARNAAASRASAPRTFEEDQHCRRLGFIVRMPVPSWSGRQRRRGESVELFEKKRPPREARYETYRPNEPKPCDPQGGGSDGSTRARRTRAKRPGNHRCKREEGSTAASASTKASRSLGSEGRFARKPRVELNLEEDALRAGAAASTNRVPRPV